MHIPPGWRTRYRILVVLVTVAAITLFGWWWFDTRIPRMHRIGVIPAEGTLVPTLCKRYPVFTGKEQRIYETPCDLVQYDWSGKQRWHIRLPLPNMTGWKNTVRFYPRSSPDGTVIAVATPNGPTLRITTWQEGQLIGRVDIPVATSDVIRTRSLALRLLTRDDGFLFAYNTQPGTPIYVIHGNHLLAQIRYQPHLSPPATGRFWQILSSDAKALIINTQSSARSYTEYVEFSHHDNSYSAKFKYILPEYTKRCFNDGVILLDDGAIYNKDGLYRKPSGWRIDEGGITSYTSTAEAYIQTNGKRHRVYNPLNGHAWLIPGGVKANWHDFSRSGQYLLVTDMGTEPERAESIQWIEEQYSGITNHNVDLSPRHFRRTLSLYTPNGRHAARMTLQEERLYRDIFVTEINHTKYSISNLLVFPTDKRMLLSGYTSKGKYKHFVYSW